MNLRPYQERTLTMLYDWMSQNNGHPVVNLPTGSGKSVVIAELCRRALSEWPETRILMLTRSMELIQQNADKLRMIWPDAPMGIYSASVGQKVLGEQITIAGPLSIVNVLDKLGHMDMLLVDEAHDISHRDEGTYRRIISELLTVNPHMRVVGWTASPFRMGHGLITDKPAIFDAIIEPVSIKELIEQGYLSLLRSKATGFALNTDGVKKRGGEFVEADLQRAVNTRDNNERMVEEVIARAQDRRSWMFFCSGVEHARAVERILVSCGIPSMSVVGSMPKDERVKAIDDFKAGRLRALTTINCLSTGFDHAGVDLLVLARPTMSPGLYMQQVGRGLRVDPLKADCLVLDFAGNVARHGPITAVKPPSKGTNGTGEAPAKPCPQCHEIVHLSAKSCTACGYEFPPPPPKTLKLHEDDDIMGGKKAIEMVVSDWHWRKHVSRASGKEMVAVTYYGKLGSRPLTEYFAVTHGGFVGEKAIRSVLEIATQGGDIGDVKPLVASLDGMVDNMNRLTPPIVVQYHKEGHFHRITKRIWI